MGPPIPELVCGYFSEAWIFCISYTLLTHCNRFQKSSKFCTWNFLDYRFDWFYICLKIQASSLLLIILCTTQHFHFQVFALFQIMYCTVVWRVEKFMFNLARKPIFSDHFCLMCNFSTLMKRPLALLMDGINHREAFALILHFTFASCFDVDL